MPPFAQKKQKRPLSCKTATSIHPVTVQRRKRTHTRVRWTQQSSASNRTSGYKRPDGNQMHNQFWADQITKFALKKNAMQVNTTPRIKVMTERGKRNSNACEMHANWNTRQLHATACALEHTVTACDCMRTGTHGNCMQLHANWNTQ